MSIAYKDFIRMNLFCLSFLHPASSPNRLLLVTGDMIASNFGIIFYCFQSKSKEKVILLPTQTFWKDWPSLLYSAVSWEGRYYVCQPHWKHQIRKSSSPRVLLSEAGRKECRGGTNTEVYLHLQNEQRQESSKLQATW